MKDERLEELEALRALADIVRQRIEDGALPREGETGQALAKADKLRPR